MPDDLAAAVDRVCDAAASALTDLAGGSSLCAIARSGSSVPAAKYHEGRLAAGTVLRRTLRDHPDDPHDALAAARDRWVRTSPPLLRSTADGRAYGEGGDDALGELAALLGDRAAP